MEIKWLGVERRRDGGKQQWPVVMFSSVLTTPGWHPAPGTGGVGAGCGIMRAKY